MREFAYIHEEGVIPEELGKIPFFGVFREDELDDVLNASNFIECDPGDQIVVEGNSDETRLHILLAGKLEIRSEGEKLLVTDRPGEVFGTSLMIHETPRQVSLIAVTHTLLLAVDQRFLKVLRPRKLNAEFYARLYEFVARLNGDRIKSLIHRVARLERENTALRRRIHELGTYEGSPFFASDLTSDEHTS